MQSLLGKSTGVDDEQVEEWLHEDCLLYTSPSPRD